MSASGGKAVALMAWVECPLIATSGRRRLVRPASNGHKYGVEGATVRAAKIRGRSRRPVESGCRGYTPERFRIFGNKFRERLWLASANIPHNIGNLIEHTVMHVLRHSLVMLD